LILNEEPVLDNLLSVVFLQDAFIDNHLPEVMSSRNMANNPFEVSAEQVRDVYRSL
jgi:hypothetical protein